MVFEYMTEFCFNVNKSYPTSPVLQFGVSEKYNKTVQSRSLSYVRNETTEIKYDLGRVVEPLKMCKCKGFLPVLFPFYSFSIRHLWVLLITKCISTGLYRLVSYIENIVVVWCVDGTCRFGC